MMDDAELLRRYAESRSEDLFSEFVGRNIGLVYNAALRRTNGDAHLAEDVVQNVFSSLAKNIRVVARHPVPAGWLYVATRNAATNLMRSERRRMAREREAMTMQPTTMEMETSRDWERLRPQLDAVLDKLDGSDRDAVLLRCLQGRPFAEIGRMLNVSDDTARKRVERALENLRRLLSNRGITSTGGALGLVLSGEASLGAPAGLAVRVSATALAAKTPVLGAIMSTTKICIGAAAAILIAAGGLLFVQHGREAMLRQEIAGLRIAAGLNGAQSANSPKETTGGVRARDDAIKGGKSRSDPNSSSKAKLSQAIPWPSLTGGMIQSSEWKNRGTATPMQTMESYLWAVDRIDVDGTADAIGFGLLREKVDGYYEGLPDSVRAEYDSPEKLWAMLLSGASHDSRIASYGIVSQAPDPAQPDNGVVMHLVIDNENGATTQGDVHLELTPGGWRYTLPDNLILPVLSSPNGPAGPK